jgi:hypothetical protein
MGIRSNVALHSTIGNSIVELYCPVDDINLVIRILQERGQQVLSDEFNPLTIGPDGKPLGEVAKQQAAKRLAYLCRNAPTRSLRTTILNGAPETLKQAVSEVFDKIKGSAKDALLQPAEPTPSVYSRFALKDFMTNVLDFSGAATSTSRWADSVDNDNDELMTQALASEPGPSAMVAESQ